MIGRGSCQTTSVRYKKSAVTINRIRLSSGQSCSVPFTSDQTRIISVIGTVGTALAIVSKLRKETFSFVKVQYVVFLRELP